MGNRLLLPALFLSVALVGCATGGSVEEPRAVSRPPSEPFPDGTAGDVEELLTKVYEQVQPWWDVAIKKARAGYKKSHCVNDRSLEAVVALHLDGDRRELERSSGCKLFDDTVLSVLSWVKEIPPRPKSLGETPGRLVLRWRFFRDKRGCEPAFARLEVESYPPKERMSRAVQASDWVEARQVLSLHRNAAVLAVLADAGLAAKDARVRRAALGVATSDRVARELRRDTSPATWQRGIEVLEQRRAGPLLVQLLGEVASARKAQDAPRIALLLDALGRLKHAVPDAPLVALLTHPSKPVRFLGLELVRDPRALARARPAFKGKPEATAALAVRWCSLIEDKHARRAVKASLTADKGRTGALEALQRFPQKFVVDEVAALVRSAKVAPADRVLAIRVLAKIPDSPLTPLRVALNAKEPAVQIAAATALGEVGRDPVPSTYRLTHVARRAEGAVAAACLAAQARLGHGPFMKELLRMMRRLDKDAYRAQVVASLWGYGEKAVPELTRLARRSKGEVAVAARKALGRIDADAAREALGKLGVVEQGRDEPVAPAEPATPLEQLLLDAAAAG